MRFISRGAIRILYCKSFRFPTLANPNYVVLAREHLWSKAEKRQLRHQNNSSYISFAPGNQVLVKEHKLSSAEDKEIQKFLMLYKGPATVVSCVHPNAYLVRDNTTQQDLGVQNVQNLKPYRKPISEL